MPIVARETGRQARELWRALAPEGWPLAPGLLPPGTALVGGAVRDGLLGRLVPKPDLDLVVPVDAIALARALGRELGGTCVVLDPERSIARLVLKGWTIDLALCAGRDLEADLARRDFTANAIALPLPAGSHNDGTVAADLQLIDPCGGLGDLAAGRLVAISEANLLDDPLRLLRGVRLACELDFTIAPASWALIRRHRQRISAVAGERVLAELERLAAAPPGAPGAGAGPGGGAAPALGGGSGSRGIAPAPRAPAEAGLPGSDGAGSGAGPCPWRGWRPFSMAQAWSGCAAAAACSSAASGCEAGTGGFGGRQSRGGLRGWRPWRKRNACSSSDSWRRTCPPCCCRWIRNGPRPGPGSLAGPADPLFHPRPPLDGRRLQSLLAIPAGPRLGRLLDHLTIERAFGRLNQTAATDTAEMADPALHRRNDLRQHGAG